MFSVRHPVLSWVSCMPEQSQNVNHTCIHNKKRWDHQLPYSDWFLTINYSQRQQQHCQNGKKRQTTKTNLCGKRSWVAKEAEQATCLPYCWSCLLKVLQDHLFVANGRDVGITLLKEPTRSDRKTDVAAKRFCFQQVRYGQATLL